MTKLLKSLAPVALIGVTLVSLASCASAPESYETVEDLKESFVKAGGECEDWNQDNKVDIASQSGTCGTNTVLSVYLSPEAVERRVEASKDSIFGSIGKDWLVGENWIINAPDIDQIQEKLGGRIVSFEASN